MIIDKLIKMIEDKKNPSVIGLDTILEYLPDSTINAVKSVSDAAKAIQDFNFALIDKLHPIIPAVKIQVACYEMYGIGGLVAFKQTLQYAKSKGLITIADVKRGDIGSTASFYSKAYLGELDFAGNKFTAFDSDFITVNGYLGSDGITPFLEDAKKYDKGIFVLCKTSNPSSGQLQNLRCDGQEIYSIMGQHINEWGKNTLGDYGYSAVGAVVGATYPKESEVLRKLMPNTLFLVPGYGAQGGKASDLKACFDANKRGAIVNSSRGIICAYKSDKYKGKSIQQAAYDAAVDMQKDIALAIEL